jgi:hypothetical protein
LSSAAIASSRPWVSCRKSAFLARYWRSSPEVAAGALHQRHHRRWPLAQQQVAPPVARHRPVLGLRRPLADQHDVAELTAALRQALAPRVAHRPPSPQAAPGANGAARHGLARTATGRSSRATPAPPDPRETPVAAIPRPAAATSATPARPPPPPATPGLEHQLGRLGPPRPPVGRSISGLRPVAAAAAIAGHLPRHRRRRPSSRCAITRQESPAAKPRETSSRSANAKARAARRGGGRRTRRSAARTRARRSPFAKPPRISRSDPPRRHHCHTSSCSTANSPHERTTTSSHQIDRRWCIHPWRPPPILQQGTWWSCMTSNGHVNLGAAIRSDFIRA